MTVVPSGGTAVEKHTSSVAEGIEGLEDLTAGDVMLPRLQLDHKQAVFRDGLSKSEYPKLTVIILGLIKQRIFWAEDTEDKDKPLCKSPDFSHGFPNVRDDTPRDKQFPWNKSNFNPADFPPGGANSLNGLVTLPCDACIFKEWDKGDSKVPPCTEQHTYAVLYWSNPDEPPEDARWTTALVTFQKTGIKPSKSYMSSFVQSKQPMFTVVTEITLSPRKRGTVEFAVPEFRKGAATDRDMWVNYGDQYRSIREFVRQPPRSLDEDDDVPATPSSNENTAPPTAAATVAPAAPAAAPPAPAAPAAPPQAQASDAPVAPAPAAAAAPSVPEPDDDLPF